MSDTCDAYFYSIHYFYLHTPLAAKYLDITTSITPA